MIKKISVFVFILFSSAIFSQTNNSNEITSNGNAKLKVKPDVAIIQITVQKQNEIEKNAIKELNEEVEKIIIGLPLNMSGEDSQKTVEARGFAEKVATITGVDVELVDERLSSAMAQNISGQKNNLDSLAAQIILQNYLDRQKSQNQN